MIYARDHHVCAYVHIYTKFKLWSREYNIKLIIALVHRLHAVIIIVLADIKKKKFEKWLNIKKVIRVIL